MTVAVRIARVLALIAFALAPALVPPAALADGVPPVTLQVRESESGRFVAEWRVSEMLPPTAIPTPVFPDSCRPVGARELLERPGARFLRQVFDCPDGIAGKQLGIDFPLLNATVSTILRVELLSGERYAHSFAPQEGPWRVPDASHGDVRARFRDVRDAVLAGARHALRQGLHWALLAVVLLLGGPSGAARLAAVFAGAQIVGLVISRAPFALHPALAEVGLATAVVLLAREALRPEGERRQLAALAACGGLLHGIGLPGLIALPPDHRGSALLFLTVAVLGMDAILLLGAAIMALARGFVPSTGSSRLKTIVAYAAGVGAVALVFGAPVTSDDGVDRVAALELPDLPIPAAGGGAPASRRLTAGLPDASIQSFVTVAPFEVRHEILVRLSALAVELDVSPGGTVAADELAAVEERLIGYLTGLHRIEIDSAEIPAAMVGADFLTLDDRGALPRPEAVDEPVDEAWIGMTSVYLTPRTPSTLTLSWTASGAHGTVPATVTDPEITRTEELTADSPKLVWVNELSQDPVPVIATVEVEAPVTWLPTLSLLVLGLGLAMAARRRSRQGLSGAIVRVALATACLVAPMGAIAVPLPASIGSLPDEAGAQRILAQLLPNVYRAFEFPTESAVYDRLALVVTGETLGSIYLEHRRAVELEERGGARARVEAVEVLSVGGVSAGADRGFVADAVWMVGGTVIHFGHRHFRQNRYDARVTVVPETGTWKIRAIEVFDEQRLQ